MMTKIRTYRDLAMLETFSERFEYLSLRGTVGESIFGFNRWVNQNFYRSPQWRSARRQAILRDEACDLGLPGYEISAELVVHHMNPISVEDITRGEPWILDPEYLITTTLDTHNAIHFGDASLLRQPVVERRPGDTKLW